MKYGNLVFVIDDIPRQLGTMSDALSETDVAIIASKLDSAAQRVRAMAPLFHSDFNIRVAPQRQAGKLRSAA